MKNFASVFGPLYIARLGEMSGNYAGVLQAIVGDVYSIANHCTPAASKGFD